MADKKERHDNCISLIRLLAALQVMCGHLIRHLSVEIPASLYNAMEYFKGVPIFFVISGMLVWRSAGRSGSCKQYLAKRFWRVYPELWVAVAVEVASVALLYENGDWG